MIFLKIIFWLFKPQFIHLAFHSQRKPVDKSKLKYVFSDSKGINYYAYINDNDIPLCRKAYMEKCFLELSSMLHDSEITMIIEAMEKAFNKVDKKGNRNVDIAMLGHLIMEMKNRKALLLSPDILMDMICTTFIRQDENPAVVDEEIHKQKVYQLTQDSKGGLTDFFYMAELNKYVPFSHESAKDLNKLIRTSMIRRESLKEQLQTYISARESEPTSTNANTNI